MLFSLLQALCPPIWLLCCLAVAPFSPGSPPGPSAPPQKDRHGPEFRMFSFVNRFSSFQNRCLSLLY